MGIYRQYICEQCGKPFQSNKEDKNRKPRFCSIQCASVRVRKMKVCPTCGKEFYNWTRERYCSKACASEALRGVPLSAEHRKKLSEARKASPKCHGENLYNWKGGQATFLERARGYRYKRKTAQHIPMDNRYLKGLRIVTCDTCFYCGKKMGSEATVDHLTPVSRGGDNQRWNLVWACRSCNSKKNAQTLEEYAEQMGFGLIDKYDMIIARVYAPYMQKYNLWKSN